MALKSSVLTGFGSLAVSTAGVGFANGMAQAVFVLSGGQLGLAVTSISASYGPQPSTVVADYTPLINGFSKLLVLQIAGIIDGQNLYGGVTPTLITTDYMDESPLFNGQVTGVPSVAEMLLSTHIGYGKPYLHIERAELTPFRCPPNCSLVIVHQGVFGIVNGATEVPVNGKVTLSVGGVLVPANQYGSQTFFGQPLR